MEQPDLNYLKMVIRSIITSFPEKVTISQVLSEYFNFEGCNLSFEHLGFNTIYELLENMTDVLRIPHNPNMNSFITLIVDEKTSHLRELVVNQKTKKQRPKRNISTLRSSNNHLPNSANYNSRVNDLDNQRNEFIIATTDEYNTPRYENSTARYDTNARGYDHVKIKSLNSKPNGTVTIKLRSDVENLCNASKKISISTLKNFLINHPDHKKMGTSNIEESINMLKYFIYIDKREVHLKDSPFNIFPSNNIDAGKYTKPISTSFLNSIVDENEEMLYLDQNDYNFDEMDDSNYENPNISENEHKISQTSISTAHHDNTILLNGISPQNAESCQKLSTDDLLSQLHKSNQSASRNSVNMFKTGLNNSVSKNNHIVPTQNSVENKCMSSTDQQFTTKPSHKKVFNLSTMEQPDLNYLKMVIRSIITSFPEKVTISQVLSEYFNFEGCNLSFEHLGFNTIYELLENMTDVLRIPHNPNMNSFITLIVDEKTSHLRELVVNQKTKKQRPKRNISTLRSSNNHLPNSANYNSRVNDLDNQRNEFIIATTDEYNTPSYENSTARYDTNTRGYDHEKIKSLNSKPNGTVTIKLRSDVENLCNASKKISISTLKNFLINHPDHKKMGTSNIEESINMLKYFIYIDKRGVHLKVPTPNNIENKCMSSTVQQFISKPSNHEPDDDLLRYTEKDICNGKFRYSKIRLNGRKVAKVIVSEVYNPSLFYIQLESEVNNLYEFMDTLQEFYEKNEEKYKVRPRLILPELPCASCYEDSNLWHRAMVLNIVDEENVQLLYVDYGTIKVVSKTNIRLLASQFGEYPTQAVHCGLYNFNELNYPREISESFAELTEDYVLEARFLPPTFEDDSQKMIVTLFLNTKHDKININKKFAKEIINQFNTNPESIGRMIYRVLQGKQWD